MLNQIIYDLICDLNASKIVKILKIVFKQNKIENKLPPMFVKTYGEFKWGAPPADFTYFHLKLLGF